METQTQDTKTNRSFPPAKAIRTLRARCVKIKTQKLWRRKTNRDETEGGTDGETLNYLLLIERK